MPADDYCYSDHEEGPFKGTEATREDAVAAAADYYPDATHVYTGIATPGKVPCDGLGWLLIEQMQERAFDNSGEHSGDWLDNLPPDAERFLDARIREAILAWVQEYGLWPNWFTVGSVERHELRRSTHAR